MALGASRDPEIVRQAAALTARESRALGVHINFAPVLDVNNNRKNPIINTRSFGESPGLVADLGKAAVRGYQENGMMATAKHFPGHGNITVDSHAKLGIIESSPDAFSSVELFPFRSIIEECKIDNIMTAHLWVKAIDKDTMPATLSQGVVTDLLREKMHFSGVIYTDAMVMGAITNRYSPEEATVRALLAGCDVILYPPNVEVGITAVKSALKSGSLTEARIDESVRRILISKTKVGIHRQRFTNTEQLASLAGTPEQSSTAKFIASRCLTLVKDDQKLIPLKSDQRIFVLTVSNKSANAIISRWLVSFPEEMKRNSSRIDVRQLSDELKSDEMDRAIAQAKKADVVIVAAYIKIILSSGNIELPPQLELFIRRLSEVNQQLVVISFGNPYIGASIPGGAAYICTYDNARALQDVAADAIYGKIPFLGKLPISISDSLRAGSGIQLKWN
jgi:beta-N-acetylhexosaminidase